MSRFNKYAKELDRIAKESFKEYKKKEESYNYAREKEQYLSKNYRGVRPANEIEYARAKANMLEAKDAFNAANNDMKRALNDINALRDKLSADVNEYFAADPDKIDINTMELLKSGILSGNDYTNLFEKATSEDNITMARIIGTYARTKADEVAKFNGTTDMEAVTCRNVANMADSINGDIYIRLYDGLADAYRRCTENNILIDMWDSLVGDIIKDF